MYNTQIMSKDVRKALDEIATELEAAQDAREFLIKNTREIIILCSKAIISIHRGNTKDAADAIHKASKLVVEYNKKAKGGLTRYMITPEQEFVEASCLMAITKKEKIPTHVELSVMPESYVLGLLDCIGELKRVILDKIRIGDTQEACRIFEIMEDLYQSLYQFSMYDKVLKDARRKIDIDRILMDSVRAIITEETRRIEFAKVLHSAIGNNSK